MSPINIDARILNKIFANQIQQYTERVKIKWPLSQGGKEFFFFNICRSINMTHHTDQLKNKTRMTILIQAENALDKIQHPFIILKNSLEKWAEGTFSHSQHNEAHINQTHR